MDTMARDCRELSTTTNQTIEWSGTDNQQERTRAKVRAKNGKVEKKGSHEMEGHDPGTTESQTSQDYTELKDTDWETTENCMWTDSWNADVWNDPEREQAAQQLTPSPSVQKQARSTQGSSIQILGGIKVCELSGCDEREQCDQNEVTSRDDSQFQDGLPRKWSTKSGTIIGSRTS